MAYSMDSTTDVCYPGTTCLINKLGIRNEMLLAETEAAFVLAAEIEPCADACFKRLAGFSGECLSHRELAEEIADFYYTVNMLHPFQEGSGRAQRIFLRSGFVALGMILT